MEQIKAITLYMYISGLIRADSLFDKLVHDIVNWREFISLLVKFAGQVKVIFQNPRRYPREAVVIIAAVLLSLFIILLLVLAVISLKKQYAIYRASRGVRKKIPREEIIRRLVIAGSILAIFIVAIAVGTSQPGVCARCHAIEKSYSEWSNSTHKTIGCLNCHYEPGAFGYVMGNINGAENLAAHFFKGEGLPRAAVANSSCLRCHNDIFNRIVVSKREIKVQHRDLITGGLTCTSCHPDTAHQAKRNKPFAMNNCVGCHNNKVASAKCETCHKQDIGYKPSRSLDDWPKVKFSKLTCTGCHKETTTQGCVACHGLSLPHSEEFKQKHAMQSEQSQGRLCYKCHWERMGVKKMCACHQEEGEIHGSPEKWYLEHRTVAKTNGMGCNCHGPSFCKRCHDDPSKVYPGDATSEPMHGGWHTGMR